MGKPILIRVAVFLAALLAGASAFSQQPEVTYSDNFQSYGSPKNPPGWVDAAIGSSSPAAGGLFKTWPDPTQGNQATNIVFGSKSSSGKPEGPNPRIGHFSTLTTKTFSATGRFEYRGRFIRTSSDSRIGFTFLSSYPEQDKYYLIGLWSVPDSTKLTMQLHGFGAGSFTGKTNSNFTPAPNTWYRFIIQVDDTDNATKVRARFWPDGTPEPAEFTIEASDTTTARLKSGRIGIWAAVKGANYVDDLAAKSPVDHTGPVITFSEGGIDLPPDSVTPVGHDARVDVRATDDISGVASITATTLTNGIVQPYTPLTPITIEGPHLIAARAVDHAGNATTSETTVLVDKTAPVITLTANGAPLPLPLARFNTTPAIEIAATDQWTGATVTATLDGVPYTSNTPITAQGTHHLVVEAVDGVQNKSIAQATILVDLGAPVIAFYEQGVKLTSPAKFRVDPAIELRLTDEHSTPSYTATLENGAPWTSLSPLPIGRHTITVTAADEAGNSASASLEVLVDKDAPVVLLRESGNLLDPAVTAKFNRDVAIDVSLSDPTSAIALSLITLNGQPYTPGTPITAEQNTHTLLVRAEDEAGNVTEVTLAILIDKSAPVIKFREGGLRLDERDLQKFRRDVAIDLDVTDAVSTATFTATLTTPALGTSGTFTSGALITIEGTHEIRVDATDAAGNTASARLTILVDKTPPAIAFSESGTSLDPTQETPFGRNIAVDIQATDNLPGVTLTAKLDGADYTSGTTITSDGPHVITARAVDAAGNTRDAEVRVLVDKTGPVIAFYESDLVLDATKRNDFNRLPSIDLRVTDAHSSVTYTATITSASGPLPYTSNTPVPEGAHAIDVRATDARGNVTEARLDLLVDVTPPVVKLRDRESGLELAPSGTVYGRNVTVGVETEDTSATTTTALLDGGPFSLSVPISQEGTRTLQVTVTDELQWATTVTFSFTIDKTPPVLTVTEGTTPLLSGASFARDVIINIAAADITPVQITATINGQPYTPGTTFATDGTHVLAVTAVDAAGNRSEPAPLTFHIDRAAPEVTLLESGQPFPLGKTFTRDIAATITINAATETTTVATIDNAPYTLGAPFTPEGHHQFKVVVTNIAGLQTTVEANFTIDKTPPSLALFASPGVPFTEGMQFAADLTPSVTASDNLATPPAVIVSLNGAELSAGSTISEEKLHSISATATDDGGLTTTVGPFGFVLDKTPPEVTVTVDGEPLVDGAKFNRAITPLIEAEDLTTPAYEITLNGASYTRTTPIEADGHYTLLIRVTDALGNERVLEPIAFIIDKTAPVVRILDTLTGEPFTGGLFKRTVKPLIQVDDLTETITVATLLNRSTGEERPWSSEQEISSDAHYTLKVTVTDDLGWVTVAPPIEFTIDQAAPVITVTESGTPLVTNTIFNRDASPKITVEDTTATTLDARLNDHPFVSESLVTEERRHTLVVKATDELGFATELLPIDFTVDKSAPVVTVSENGVPFLDQALLDHDAVPVVTIADLTPTTIDARVDGEPFAPGGAVTAEGPHTFDVVVTDAAGWRTTVPTIRFIVDKTAPVVAIARSEGGLPLQSGDEFNTSITPWITVTDLTATTISAKLNGLPWTPNSVVSEEGAHLLEVTATDAVGRTTIVPPIAFIIDKTPPVVRILESSATLAHDTKLNRPAQLAIEITDLTATTTQASIGETPFTFPGTVNSDGRHTLSVTVTDNLGQATVVPPVAFVVDQTLPVVTITEGGQPLLTGRAFDRNVRPELTVDDLTATTVVATLNGTPYTMGTEIADEGKYTLAVRVTDELGWTTVAPAILFFIDRTPPVVTLKEGDDDLTDGLWFNRDVTPRVVVTDTTETTTTATLAKDGAAAASFSIGDTISDEGAYTLSVTVTDQVGLATTVPPVTFTIDKTPPAITILYPAANAELNASRVVVAGDSDDAITVTVNEVLSTTIDPAEKQYSTIEPLELGEGDNLITVVGVDAAGNSTTLTQLVRLDTRAPELTITTPAANACLTTRTVEVTGTVADPNVTGVRVAVSTGTAAAAVNPAIAPIDATLSADRKTWTATVTFPSEGKFVLYATARDVGGHESVASLPLLIDETKPRIEITDGGVSPIPPFVNRPIAPRVRVLDADPNATLTVTLDGVPFVSGTAVGAEKSYELKASATDCAGNAADEVIVRFVIDRTAPQFLTLSPPNGGTAGAMPQISGTVSPDTAAVFVEQTGAAASVTNGTFAFGALPITEGTNRLMLVAVDPAGNRTRLDYTFTVKTVAPTVDILENGSPIANGTSFNRQVTVEIRSNEPDATITATRNGQPFTSGTTITDNGPHTILATARDTFAHSSTREVTFTIDRIGPVVTIIEPADDATVSADRIRVRGTVTGDAVSATLNGAALTLTAGAFDTEGPLELGLNVLTVAALDATGNLGQASVEVTRSGGTLGIILSSPVNNMLTNRRTTTVGGQVLSPAGVTSVTINGIEIAIDAAGAFRKTDFPLTEGPNVITAVVQKGTAEGTVSVTVHADFTPPAILVTESGNALDDESRFESQAVITVTATDSGAPVTPALFIDTAAAVSPATVTTAGGHTLLAIATDAAGNETRVERMFFIGGGSTSGCALTGFDPADGSIITSDRVTLIGRTGGAPGVKVNGTAAIVSSGSFSATLNLSVEGPKTFTIRCTDANGTEIGDAETLTLTSVTGAPSVTITSPANHSVTADELITVSGTIAGNVTQLLVNGTAATITGTTFTASNIRLSSGINVIVACAKSSAGRTSADSIHVTWLKDLPTITITSPATALTARSETIDVSGVWTGLDAPSLTVTRGETTAPVQTTITSDTTGTFKAAAVPLVSGLQTITVRGLDRLGRSVTATIDVTRADGSPAITIASPVDNTYFGAAGGASFVVNGTFTAEAGATIEVNGQPAVVDTATSTFTANVTFSTLLSTPVLARVTEPTGQYAIDTIRVTKLNAAPSVLQTFPEADAVDVDSGVLPLLLFSAPMDRSAVRTAFRLEDAAGAAVSGDVILDRDVLTFAPAALLLAGERYTMRVAASAPDNARDLAGNALASPFTSSFTVAATAPEAAPTLDPHPARACSTLEITGTAPPAARVRIDLGTITFNTTASATGAFTFTLPLSGRSGFQIARVRVVGSDGSLSAAAEAQFEVDCAGPVVTNATFDRTTNALTLSFSKAIDLATITTGTTGSIRLQLGDGTIVTGAVSALPAPGSVLITPAQNLTAASFTLTVTTDVKDTSGMALTAPYARAFTTGEPTIGDGGGSISGEIFDADTGRPLPAATITIEVPTGAFLRTSANAASVKEALLHPYRGANDLTLNPVAARPRRLPPATLLASLRDDAAVTIENAPMSSASHPARVPQGQPTRVPEGQPEGSRWQAAQAARPPVNTRTNTGTPAGVQDNARAQTTLAQSTRGQTTHTQTASAQTTNTRTNTGTPAGVQDGTRATTHAQTTRAQTANTATNTGDPNTALVSAIADNRGRYLRELPEGAHTIRASADGYTTVWRQIIVRTGAGVIPTDIRLTPHGVTENGTGAQLTLNHGGAPDSPLSRPATLTIPPAVVTSGNSVTLTSIGAQSLAGLLPLGWSPIASAEIVTGALSLAGTQLQFTVPAQAITAASQTLTAVRYAPDRDEWRVITAVITLNGDHAVIPVNAAGAYALVYPDQDPRLVTPPAPVTGGVLAGVTDPCLETSCPPLATSQPLELVPPVVLPTQRTVATLIIDGANASLFPSGTAVQAYVDEELQLADGSRDLVAPFATDLLLYRTLDGATGEAVFHLAPSARAAEVVLEIGYDHIRILPYPERLDRGTLVGPEGGRVPADDGVAVEIPAGATIEALQASATSIHDFAPFGTIPGYRIAGGLSLYLQWASQGAESSPVELTKPARATFTVDDPSLPSQLILVEVLEGTPYARLFRLASQITTLEGGTRHTTKPIDRAVLPLDGIIREGTYLLLAPNAPIAFATGTVHIGTGGAATANARVLTPTLGVAGLTRITGIFNVPIPAAVFSLVPRTPATGDGATYTHPSAPPIDAVVNVGPLSIIAQPPSLTMTVFAHVNGALTEVSAGGASVVSLSTSVKASFSPGLDPLTVREDSITVIDTADGSVVSGRSTAQGNLAILWSLTPGTRLRADARYTVVVSGTVRGISGTPVGSQLTATFATAGTLSDPNVDPSKIRITVPDAEGRSQIIGAPGALKEHWNAVAVRRGRDFSTRPQATADAQRSFAIQLGAGNDPNDRITIADVIYLQIINEAGAVAAILPLGPFTTEDNRGFVARPEVETRYTTVDNVTLSVPAGAFDVATLVRIEPAQRAAVAGVPGFDEELTFHAGFKIDFEGIAKKRLDITFPKPSTLGESQTPYLGHYGISARGPRIMVIDLLRRDGANLTTHHPEGSSLRMGGVASNAIVNPTVLRDMLLGIDRASIVIGFNITAPISWVTFAAPAIPLDLFVPPINSLYFASFATERDRILMPVPAAGAFHLVGVDPESGLTLFEAPYEARAPGEPADATDVPLPSTNDRGPYPVFVSPGRSEILNIYSRKFTEESVRNIVAEYDGSTLLLKNAPRPLPPRSRVEAINLRTGVVAVTDDFISDASMSLAAEVGDQVLLLIADHNINPASILTVVFNEPIKVGSDEEMRELFKLLVRDPAVFGSTFQPIAGLLDIRSDSGGRRISIVHRGSFQRGMQYRLRLSEDIVDRDPTDPLQLAQTKGFGGPGDLHLDFSVRAPHGPVSAFEIPQGSVRDLALRENILLVSALEGGILAFDVSNPMVLGTTPPLAHIPSPGNGLGQSWGLAVDRHDRFFATGVSPMYGVVRSYRIEDLYCNGPACPADPQRSNAIISWRTGINVGMPLSSMIIGGWPEAIPRKLRVITRDRDPEAKTFTELAVNGATDLGNGYWKATITVNPEAAAYDEQRVTVTNMTRNYHWSVDVPQGGSAPLTIIGQPLDTFHIVRNLSTLGVVSLFGHGIGVYDLNAVEANSRNLAVSSWDRMNETIVVSDGDLAGASACDRGARALIGQTCEIGSLALSPESAVAVTDMTASILALDQNRGMVHLTVQPQTSTLSAATFGRRGSIVFAERLIVEGQGYRWFGHPRLNRLRNLYQAAAGREPRARYTSIDTFTRGEETYAIVAGLDYGLLVVRLSAALKAESLVDVIWIPAGAQSVRVSSAYQLASIVDGNGRVLLVNLGDIDESSKMTPVSPCTNIDCEWDLFPTALAALTGPSAGGIEVGAPDPRIVWTSPNTPSDDPLVFGTLPPVFDPETGFLYAGSVLSKKMKVVSAIDPRVRFIGDTGASTLQDLDTVVPLGIKPPPDSVKGPNGSRAAFRLEALLPGSLMESMAGEPVRIAIESEPIVGVASVQTLEPLPRANLRQDGPRPANGFHLIHDAPAATSDPDVARLRYQRGWNRMVTPWIVAIADPRASEKYVWQPGANKESEGCYSCDRPEHLKLRGEPEVFELYTAGRTISARPEVGALSGPWLFLGEASRLNERVNTIMADTVRLPSVAVAGHNPPIIGGAVQQTYYAHSGELETASIDLNAGGRAGVDVVLDRTYRSRTLGSTVLGAGWDSLILQRIRSLPNGDAEYRDGLGNVWLFEKPTTGALNTYKAPKGVYLKLQRTLDGWTITDPAWNQTKFDLLGRIVSFADYLNDDKPVSGSTLRYGYNGEGQLSTIVDSYGRLTKLSYWTEADIGTSGAAPGNIRTVTDWRDRKIDYEYESGTLTTVWLPEVKGDVTLGPDYTFTGSRRPRFVYQYGTGSAVATFNDEIEIKTNLKSIKDPTETLSPGGQPRVTFTYYADPDRRDRIQSETSSLPECSSGTCGVVDFSYPADLQMDVTDLLGQVRHYEVTPLTLYDKRQHFSKVVEKEVPVVTATETDLFTREKAVVSESVALEDLETRFEYDGEGELTEVRHPHGLVTTFGYLARMQGPAHQVLQSVTDNGPNDLITTYDYYGGVRDENRVKAVTRKDPASLIAPVITREFPRPRLGALTTTVLDEEIEVKTVRDPQGRPTEINRTAPGGSGVQQTTEATYHDTGALIALGQPETIETGDGTGGGTKVRSTYTTLAAGGYRVTSADLVRNVTVVEDRDSHERPTYRQVVEAGGSVVEEERFGYDADGRPVVHRRKQSGVSGDLVEQTVAYDRMGRATETTLSNAAVNGAPTIIRTRTLYDIGTRTTTEYDPFESSLGASTVTQTDRLGRAERTEYSSGGSVVKRLFGYDRQGGLAYETDGVRTARLAQRDAHGREIAELSSDGTRQTQTWDAWNQLTSINAFSALGAGGSAAEKTAQTNFKYSPYGRRYGTAVGVSSGSFLTSRSRFAEDGATEITRVGETALPTTMDLEDWATLRTVATVLDRSGRVVLQRTGEGPFGVPADPETYSETNVLSYRGSVPQTIERKEPRSGTGAAYRTTLLHDALGRVTEVQEAGNYVSNTQYDEAGNAVVSLPAGYAQPWVRHYDSRGLLVREEAPAGKATRQEYDARGVMRRYVDEAGKETTYATDDLGRVRSITYEDGSSEEMLFENVTGQLAAQKARNGQWFSYYYDGGGRVLEVRVASTPRSSDPSATPVGEPWLRYLYDFGGRLRRVTSPDAATDYDDPDWMGRPRVTRSIRYKDHSGLSMAPQLLDVHTQAHVWTAYGSERSRWRMPAAGPALPGDEVPSQWRKWIIEEHDPVGNLIGLKAAADATATPGTRILIASARGPGRLLRRSRYYDGGDTAEQTYAFADGAFGSPPGPVSGDLVRSVVHRNGVPLAGSEVSRDTARRQALVNDLGIPNRHSDFGYDQLGRLLASSLLWPASGSPAPTVETLIHSDFRQARAVANDPVDLAELGSSAPLFAPQSWTATSNDVHQYVQRTMAGGAAGAYTFETGRRMSDGAWTFEYDHEDRVTSAQRAELRIEYEYDAAGRIIGRRHKKMMEGSAAFEVENRPAELAKYGLPAETTWVWDPVVDRLVAIFEAGRSTAVTSPAADAGLVRQYVHSDRGYDDPVEVHVAADGGQVLRYMPVIDEAGTGSLQAVVSGATGRLAERVLYADAYGDAPRYLHGALVDKIEIEAAKRGDGSIDTVKVRLRLSELVDQTTAPAGLQIGILGQANTLIATATGTVEVDEATITVTLTGTEWTSLTAMPDARHLEIAVANSLRASLWEGPVMAMPEWLLDGSGRATSPAFPVIQRESLSSISNFMAGIGNNSTESQTLLEIHNLYLAAATQSKTKILTGFKAAPFVEPGTGLAYLRDRWYDPSTGTWMTPDAYGTIDSSNLYAYCANDPVNCSDPMGTFGVNGIGPIEQYALGRFAQRYVTDPQFAADTDAVLDVTMQVVSSPAFQGTMQIVGGCGEAAAGAYAVGQTGGLAAVPGWIAFAHGSDVCGTGFRTLWTGQVQESFTKQGAEAGLIAVGVSPETAGVASAYVDLGISAFGTVGSSRALLGLSRGMKIRPVRALDTGRFDVLTERSVVGDALDNDHIPSFASIRTARARKLGRSLTPIELRALRECTNCLNVPEAMHRAGRTFGWRNTQAQIQQDSIGLARAAHQDLRFYIQSAPQFGMSKWHVRVAAWKLHGRNLLSGVYWN